MALTGPYPRLTKHLPLGRLVSIPVIISLFGAISICFAFQLGSVYWVMSYKDVPNTWYFPVPTEDDVPDNVDSDSIIDRNDIGTTLFFVGGFQLLFTCLVFSIAKPFKKPMYTNYLFTGSIIILFTYTVYLFFFASKFECDLYYLVCHMKDHVYPMSFKIKLFGYILANAVALYLFEKIVVWKVTLWRKDVGRKEREAIEEQRLIELSETNHMVRADNEG